MADDKKKEDQGGEGKKKKGLPAIVMIAIGAIVGGAGVVFAIPPKTVEKIAPPPVFEEVHVTHPDLIQHAFNPKQRSGKGVAKISFKFVYTVVQDVAKKDVEHTAFELIKQNWDRATGNSLTLLRSRSYAELNSAAGTKILEHDLMQLLTNTLFPGEHPIAQVTEVIWKDWLLQ